MAEKLYPAKSRCTLAPGRSLQIILDISKWGQKDLGGVLGRPAPAIGEICCDKKRTTAATALELGAALGVKASAWLAWDAENELREAAKPSPAIKRRAARMNRRRFTGED